MKQSEFLAQFSQCWQLVQFAIQSMLYQVLLFFLLPTAPDDIRTTGLWMEELQSALKSLQLIVGGPSLRHQSVALVKLLQK